MKHYTWNPDKNKILKKERYPNQKISVVLIEGYAYLIPFVESDTEIFLKTIIPSRKATKQYIGEYYEQT